MEILYKREKERREGKVRVYQFFFCLEAREKKKDKRWDGYEKRWRKGRMEMESRGGGD